MCDICSGGKNVYIYACVCVCVCVFIQMSANNFISLEMLEILII